MSLQNAVQFIRRVRGDGALRERVRGMAEAGEGLDELVRLAGEQALPCTEPEIRKAYGLDWGMRAGARLGRAPAVAGTAPLWPHGPPRGPETLVEALSLGNVVRFRGSASEFTVVAHPDDAVSVLTGGGFRRGWGYDVLRAILGDNLLTSDGDVWREQRRRAQPAFRTPALDARLHHVRDVAERLAHRWKGAGGRVEASDNLREELAALAGAVFIGDEAAGPAAARLPSVLASIEGHPGIVLGGAEVDESACVAERREALDAVHACTATRSPGAPSGDDFLSTLLRGHGLASMEDASEDVFDEVSGVLAGGVASVGSAAAWMLWLVSTHPGVADRVHEEVRTGGGEYARAVVRETLRLYPPVWILPRYAEQDTEIGGFTVRRHAAVAVSPYVTHRHPEFWPEPQRFDPSRFLTEDRDRHHYAYIPFGIGRHHCIGQYLGMQELTILLTVLCTELQFGNSAQMTGVGAGMTLYPKSLVLDVSARR